LEGHPKVLDSFWECKNEIEEFLLALFMKRKKRRVMFEVAVRAIKISQSAKR